MPTIKKPTPTLDHIKKVATGLKEPTVVLKTGSELASKLNKLSQVAEALTPKMTIIKDGPQGPSFVQSDVKELEVVGPKEHAKVYVEYSRKLSDGNYGSVGFTVGLQMPTGTAYHEIEEGFNAACQFVDGKLTELLNAATKKG